MKEKVIQNLINKLETLVPAGEGFRYGADYNKDYGGYRLVKIKNTNETYSGCFGKNGREPRLSYTSFVLELRSLIKDTKKSLKPKKVIKTIKVIAVYDNGGKTLDRYTIVVNQRKKRLSFKQWFYDCISSSENGLGVFMWGDCTRGKHLGKKIKLEDLSKELQEKIQNALS